MEYVPDRPLVPPDDEELEMREREKEREEEAKEMWREMMDDIPDD